jgi:hypothetical protein
MLVIPLSTRRSGKQRHQHFINAVAVHVQDLEAILRPVKVIPWLGDTLHARHDKPTERGIVTAIFGLFPELAIFGHPPPM